MAFIFEIEWSPGGYRQKYVQCMGDYYVLTESERLSVNLQVAWCDICAGVSQVESLYTLDEIDNRIGNLNDPLSKSYPMDKNGVLLDLTPRRREFPNAKIDDLLRRRQWRQGRVAPPKCLRCDLSDFFVMKGNGWQPSPVGDGKYKIELYALASVDREEKFFTPEGDRVK